MHTAGLPCIDMIPTPDRITPQPPANPPLQFVGQNQGFRDANSDRIDGILFPEAFSSWSLSKVLWQLSNPEESIFDSRAFDGIIWDHAKMNAAERWRSGGRFSTLGMDLM